MDELPPAHRSLEKNFKIADYPDYPANQAPRPIIEFSSGLLRDHTSAEIENKSLPLTREEACLLIEKIQNKYGLSHLPSIELIGQSPLIIRFDKKETNQSGIMAIVDKSYPSKGEGSMTVIQKEEKTEITISIANDNETPNRIKNFIEDLDRDTEKLLKESNCRHFMLQPVAAVIENKNSPPGVNIQKTHALLVIPITLLDSENRLTIEFSGKDTPKLEDLLATCYFSPYIHDVSLYLVNDSNAKQETISDMASKSWQQLPIIVKQIRQSSPPLYFVWGIKNDLKQLTLLTNIDDLHNLNFETTKAMRIPTTHNKNIALFKEVSKGHALENFILQVEGYDLINECLKHYKIIPGEFRQKAGFHFRKKGSDDENCRLM